MHFGTQMRRGLADPVCCWPLHPAYFCLPVRPTRTTSASSAWAWRSPICRSAATGSLPAPLRRRGRSKRGRSTKSVRPMAGRHEVGFRYDLNVNPMASLNEGYNGTRVGGHPVVISLLLGTMRGSMPFASTPTRMHGSTCARRPSYWLNQVKERYGKDGWVCKQGTPGADEQPVGGLFIKEHCEKATASRHFILDRELYRNPNQDLTNFVGGPRLLDRARQLTAKPLLLLVVPGPAAPPTRVAPVHQNAVRPGELAVGRHRHVLHGDRIIDIAADDASGPGTESALRSRNGRGTAPPAGRRSGYGLIGRARCRSDRPVAARSFRSVRRSPPSRRSGPATSAARC